MQDVVHQQYLEAVELRVSRSFGLRRRVRTKLNPQPFQPLLLAFGLVTYSS